VNLGILHISPQGTTGAQFGRPLKLNDNLPGAHAMLGTALLAQSFARDSFAHLQKAEADDLLGVALLESGRPRDAIDQFETALARRAEDPDVLYYLARA
jgi:hypothetical protein